MSSLQFVFVKTMWNDALVPLEWSGGETVTDMLDKLVVQVLNDDGVDLTGTKLVMFPPGSEEGQPLDESSDFASHFAEGSPVNQEVAVDLGDAETGASSKEDGEGEGLGAQDGNSDDGTIVQLQLPQSGTLVAVNVNVTIDTAESMREGMYEELGFEDAQCSYLCSTDDLEASVAEELMGVIGQDPGEYKLRTADDAHLVLVDSLTLAEAAAALNISSWSDVVLEAFERTAFEFDVVLSHPEAGERSITLDSGAYTTIRQLDADAHALYGEGVGWKAMRFERAGMRLNADDVLWDYGIGPDDVITLEL